MHSSKVNVNNVQCRKNRILLVLVSEKTQKARNKQNMYSYKRCSQYSRDPTGIATPKPSITSRAIFTVTTLSLFTQVCFPLWSGYRHAVRPVGLPQSFPRFARCLGHTNIFSTCWAFLSKCPARCKISSLSVIFSFVKWHRLEWAVITLLHWLAPSTCSLHYIQLSARRFAILWAEAYRPHTHIRPCAQLKSESIFII